MRCDQYIGLNRWASELVSSSISVDEDKNPYYLLMEFKENIIEKIHQLYDSEQIGLDARNELLSLDFNNPVINNTIQCFKKGDSKKRVGYIEGAWDDKVADLYQYTLSDGKVYTEYVQADPWSSGPCYFIALKDENDVPISESLWTEEEIEGYL